MQTIKLGTCSKVAAKRTQKCHFSLPRVKSCPGITESCYFYCYCKRGHHNYRSTRDLRLHNWKIWLAYRAKKDKQGLADLLVSTIRQDNKLPLFRWFEEGDLLDQFSVDTVAIAIAELSELQHMVVTKSIMLDLDPIAALPNVGLLLSADQDNIDQVIAKASEIRSKGYNCKIAYSALPVGTKQKQAIACPATGNGKLHSVHGACQLCKRCFKSDNKDVIFYKH